MEFAFPLEVGFHEEYKSIYIRNSEIDNLIKLRILHISDAGLPDLRIEKMAHTMKKEGHELIFLGGRPVRGQNLDAFDETHSLWLKSSFRLVFDPRIERSWLRAIDALKPDIVHAHNLIVGHFLLNSEHHAVFDDHEYYSKQSSRYNVWPFLRRQLVKPMIRRFSEWEEKLVSRFPTLTSNRNIANDHRKHGSFVKHVPNVPMENQISGLIESQERKGYVYIGNDFKMKRFLPHRNMEGLQSIIKVDAITGLTHREMMEQLMKYDVGLTPWHEHPWHPYSEANKNYEYMHAGMPVLANSIIKKYNFSDDPYVFSFKTYADLKEQLNTIPRFDRKEIQKHAISKYTWEENESTILEAYNRA
jgi:hypothetical protein